MKNTFHFVMLCYWFKNVRHAVKEFGWMIIIGSLLRDFPSMCKDILVNHIERQQVIYVR
ncbi:MAG: hypothetical protein JWM20_396 [Patescibacteria group bacterium]|nr:hypothetical protein [Patescibacteria group bacterium]